MLPTFSECAIFLVIFHLWISCTWFDTFTMVMNFVDNEWQLQHVTVGLFKASNALGGTFAEIVKCLLQTFEPTTYVKDKGANLTTLVVALSSMVTCKPLGLTMHLLWACHE